MGLVFSEFYKEFGMINGVIELFCFGVRKLVFCVFLYLYLLVMGYFWEGGVCFFRYF